MFKNECNSKLKALHLYFNEHKTIENIAFEVGWGQIYVISWIHHFKQNEKLKQNTFSKENVDENYKIF